MFTALDNPARQGLAWNIDAVAAEYFFEAVQWSAIDVLGSQQHRQNAGAEAGLVNGSRSALRCLTSFNWRSTASGEATFLTPSLKAQMVITALREPISKICHP